MASLAGGEPISIGQLAQVTVTKQPTVTRLLDRMEAREQVERLPHDSDRRVTLVRITRKGTKAVEHLMELAREHERRVLEPFGLQRAEELKGTQAMAMPRPMRPAPTAAKRGKPSAQRKLRLPRAAAASTRPGRQAGQAERFERRGPWRRSRPRKPADHRQQAVRDRRVHARMASGRGQESQAEPRCLRVT